VDVTREEVLRQLQERGVAVGKWTVMPEGAEVEHPFAERQRVLLKQLVPLLEEQIEKDVRTVAELRVGLARVEKARALQAKKGG
jgi:hypothetical protein